MSVYRQNVDVETIQDIKNAIKIVALTAAAFSILSWMLYEPELDDQARNNSGVEFAGSKNRDVRPSITLSGTAIAGMN